MINGLIVLAAIIGIIVGSFFVAMLTIELVGALL
jgi:hypothetical protein